MAVNWGMNPPEFHTLFTQTVDSLFPQKYKPCSLGTCYEPIMA